MMETLQGCQSGLPAHCNCCPWCEIERLRATLREAYRLRVAVCHNSCPDPIVPPEHTWDTYLKRWVADHPWLLEAAGAAEGEG